MPELLTSPEAEPQRPGWLADQAVRGEPVSAIKNREKYREIWISGWKMAAGASPAPMFRAFLPLRTQKINREGDFAITGKCIAKNRESCQPNCNRVDNLDVALPARGNWQPSHESGNRDT